MLLPNSPTNHISPSTCTQPPTLHIDLHTLRNSGPGSVRQTSSLDIGNPVPGRTDWVSSPGISPKLQTDFAAATSAPAPCTSTHAATHEAMMPIVTIGVRSVLFSS